MSRLYSIIAACLLAGQAGAAVREFDFGKFNLNETPKGFRSVLSGQGKPGDWKIVLDDVPPLIAPLTPKAANVTRRPVLAQLSQENIDEHFPLLIFDDDVYGDFTLTTRFKTVSGAVEQMAGVAFRIQDEKNFYVVRASSIGNSFRFYKMVNGQRTAPIGPEVPIAKGVWHELTIECKGNQIRCLLNGKEAIPLLTDNSFPVGKFGFWTKSDSVSYFTDLKLNYTPRELLAQAIVRSTIEKYGRLKGLRIYGQLAGKSEHTIIASTDAQDLGQPATQLEKTVIAENKMYYGRERTTVTVTMPLHDRNGETVAAVRITMESFLGQTEQNAIVRAMPIIKFMEERFKSAKDLVE